MTHLIYSPGCSTFYILSMFYDDLCDLQLRQVENRGIIIERVYCLDHTDANILE